MQAGRVALFQFLVLLGLWAAAFRTILWSVIEVGLRDPAAMHLLAAPLLIAALAWRKRREIRAALDRSRGSAWGAAVMLAAVGVHAAPAEWWPPSVAGWLRVLPPVAALAGIVLAVGGRRVLAIAVPMILMMAMAIPLNSPHYPFLIVTPENHTLQAARIPLAMIPGATVEAGSAGLTFSMNGRSGVIPLGQEWSRASLMLSYLTIWLAAGTWQRRERTWRWIAGALLALPLAVICNGVRMLTWGALAVTGVMEDGGEAVQRVAVAVSLALAYGLSWLLMRAGDDGGEAAASDEAVESETAGG